MTLLFGFLSTPVRLRCPALFAKQWKDHLILWTQEEIDDVLQYWEEVAEIEVSFPEEGQDGATMVRIIHVD